MASRKILEISKGPYMAKVYRDPDFNEYHVRLFCGKQEKAEATYFTCSRPDAEVTAGFMVREAYEKGVRV